MSKSLKGGCKYKFNQGAKKGKLCGRPCRGKFCFQHKPKNKLYKAEWYQERQKQQNCEEVNRILDIDNIDKLPNIEKLNQKKYKLLSEKMYIFKKLIGVNIRLGIDQKSEIALIEKILFGKCTCSKLTIDDITEEQLEEAKEDVSITHYYKTDKKIKKYMIDIKKCSQCDKYNANNCKYCYRTNKIIFFEYEGNATQAKRKQALLKKTLVSFDIKIKKIIQIIDATNKRIKMLEEDIVEI